MVVFGLFSKICASHNTTHSSSPAPINKSKDVLDELMAMDKNYTHSAKDKSNLNTSSFNLDDIINRMPAKGEIDYKNALLNSLYAQIEYLRNDLSAKNEIIKAIISMQNKYPNYTEVKNTSSDKEGNSSESTSFANTTNDNDDVFEYAHNSMNNAHSSSLHLAIEISSNSSISDGKNDDTSIQSGCDDVENELNKSENVHNLQESHENNLESEDLQVEKTASLKYNLRGEIHNDYMLNGSFHPEVDEPEKESLAPWEKHSMGFGSRMLQKFGYGGKGLGKDGKGIIHPVSIEKKSAFNFINRGLENLIADHNNTNSQTNRVNNIVQPWPNGTTLITGSSILLGVDESRLKKYKAKVRAFPGATVDDMFDYILPLLKKTPTYIILHIGSNDSHHKSSNEIAGEISCLKEFIYSVLPSVRIFISCPVIRMDDMKANKTLRDLRSHLICNENDLVDNDNVDSSCLGKKGLHLNPKGSGRLAINYISLMRRL